MLEDSSTADTSSGKETTVLDRLYVSRLAFLEQIKLQELACARETRGNIPSPGMDEGWAFPEVSIKGSHPVSDPLARPGHCCQVNRICGVGTGWGLPFGSWHALFGEQTSVSCEDKRERGTPCF